MAIPCMDIDEDDDESINMAVIMSQSCVNTISLPMASLGLDSSVLTLDDEDVE